MTADRPARSGPCPQALYFKDLVRTRLGDEVPEHCLIHPLIIAPFRHSCHTVFRTTQATKPNQPNLGPAYPALACEVRTWHPSAALTIIRTPDASRGHAFEHIAATEGTALGGCAAEKQDVTTCSRPCPALACGVGLSRRSVWAIARRRPSAPRVCPVPTHGGDRSHPAAWAAAPPGSKMLTGLRTRYIIQRGPWARHLGGHATGD